MARTLTAVATLVDGQKAFLARGASGHEVLMDAATTNHGNDRGPRPMEMLLFGMAGCAGMVLITLLRKMRQEPDAHAVEIVGEYSDEVPGRIVRARIHHKLRGASLRRESVERALELTEKACPVGISVCDAIAITQSFEIDDGSQADGRSARTPD